MIKADVIMVPVSREWEGKSYYEFYTQKLLQEDDLMGVAIYRRHEASRRRQKGDPAYKQWSYIMTGPPAKETHMMKGDRVICFSSAFKIREEDLEEIEEEAAAAEGDKKIEDAKPTPLNADGADIDKAKSKKDKMDRKEKQSPKARPKAKAGVPNTGARVMMMR